MKALNPLRHVYHLLQRRSPFRLEARFRRTLRQYLDRIVPYGREPEDREVVVAEVFPNAFMYFSTTLLASVIARAKGARVLYLAEHEVSRHYLGGMASWFAPARFTSVEELCRPHRAAIDRIVDGLYSGLATPDDVLKLEYAGLPIGDLVYDQSMRQGSWQATVWRVDERVRTSLRASIECIFACTLISEQYTVRGCVVHDSTSTYLGSMFRYFVQAKVETFIGVGGSLSLRRYVGSNRMPPDYPFRPTRQLLDELTSSGSPVLAERTEQYLRQRFAGLLNQGDVLTAFAASKRVYTRPEEFCAEYGLNPTKPCVFVMLHAFNDFPHIAGNIVFRDYYWWFVETLAIARNETSVNWVFKQHPSIAWYPHDVDLPAKFAEAPRDNVVYLDEREPLHTASLPHIAAAVVTCIGTAGLEMSCCGIPAVVAGEGFYTGFGVCHECHDVVSYRETLGRVATLAGPGPEQQKLAKLLLYLTSGGFEDEFHVVPSYNHYERASATVPAVMTHILEQIGTPATRRYLTRVAEFARTPGREQLLDLEMCCAWERDAAAHSKDRAAAGPEPKRASA